MRGVDLIESGATSNIYNVDLKTAIEWLNEIWNNVTAESIKTAGLKPRFYIRCYLA